MTEKKKQAKLAKNIYYTWLVVAVCTFLVFVLSLLSLIKVLNFEFSYTSGMIISALVFASALLQCITYRKSEKITFEKAVPGMENEITEMINEAKKVMIDSGIDQWDELYPTINDVRCDIKNDELIIMRKGGKLAGCYTLNEKADTAYNYGEWKDTDGKYMVVHRLVVNPKYQGLGYAKVIMKHVEEVVKNSGATSIRLDTFTKNPVLNNLYRELGFTYVGDAYWRKGKFSLLEKIL